jgi:hypothetical protein
VQVISTEQGCRALQATINIMLTRHALVSL